MMRSPDANKAPEAPDQPPFVLSKSAPYLFKGLLDEGGSIPQSLQKINRRFTGSSSQPALPGVVPHPFNMTLADSLVQVNPHHSACQNTLIAATMGGGLGVIAAKQPEDLPPGSLPMIDEARTLELNDTLDDLCDQSFTHEMGQVIRNFWGVGGGYLEASRDDGGTIEGLFWVPAPDTYKVLPTEHRKDYFYETWGDSHERIYFAPFNKIERTKELMQSSRYTQVTPNLLKRPLTEIIPFLQPATRWEHYGAPHWGAAAAHMDVDTRSLQRVSDYMENGGMPQHLLAFMGFKATEGQVEQIRQVLTGGLGRRTGGSAAVFFQNAMKSIAELKHIALGNDLDHEGYAKLHETINLAVATANQVPPVLAGIATPGKMAASNEQVLAMVTMQRSVIDVAQRLIQSMLRKTLFNSVGGIKGFAGTRVRFRTWLESTDIQSLNVVARQRESVAESPSRDPKDGFKR